MRIYGRIHYFIINPIITATKKKKKNTEIEQLVFIDIFEGQKLLVALFSVAHEIPSVVKITIWNEIFFFFIHRPGLLFQSSYSKCIWIFHLLTALMLLMLFFFLFCLDCIYPIWSSFWNIYCLQICKWYLLNLEYALELAFISILAIRYCN